MVTKWSWISSCQLYLYAAWLSHLFHSVSESVTVLFSMSFDSSPQLDFYFELQSQAMICLNDSVYMHLKTLIALAESIAILSMHFIGQLFACFAYLLLTTNQSYFTNTSSYIIVFHFDKFLAIFLRNLFCLHFIWNLCYRKKTMRKNRP